MPRTSGIRAGMDITNDTSVDAKVKVAGGGAG